MKVYSLLLLVGLSVLSCSSKETSTSTNSGLAVDPTEKITSVAGLEKLKIKKAQTDTLVSKNSLTLEILVKEPESDKLVVVVNENYPDEVEVTYNIWRNADGKILLVGEYPYSQSGDWDIGYEHYFDESGLTFSFQKRTNFFNSFCADGVAYENVVEYYDSSFNRLHQTYSLIDENKQNLKKEDCEFPYDYPYEVSNSLKDYLKRINYGS